MLGEEAEGRAGVEDQHQVEEARHRDHLAAVQVRQHELLGDLVEHADHHREDQPGQHQRQGSACVGCRAGRRHRAGGLRHGRALRLRRTGCSRSVRTASDARRRCRPCRRKCQQRSHFCAALGLATMRSSSAWATSDSVAAEVMVTKRRSSPRLAMAANLSAVSASSSSACSEAPTLPSVRSASIDLEALGAHRADRLPARDQAGLAFLRRQGVEGVQHHAVRGLAGPGRVEDGPGLLGGEGQDRRHQLQQRLRDVPQRGLRGAARQAASGGGVQAVLEDVEVEGAQVLRAEHLQRLHDAVELHLRVVGLGLLRELAGEGERVAVEIQPLLERHRRPWRCRSRRVLASRKRRVLRTRR